MEVQTLPFKVRSDSLSVHAEVKWLLGAGCGESRTSGFEGEVRRSNVDIDSNCTEMGTSGSNWEGREIILPLDPTQPLKLPV
ncbi:MAG: hypothetical protein ICV63_07955 [Coleofasciculus sp. Co-bin14]|nr:hypothetical protein [Coleofasciculus sp. Co-bin14]